MVNPADLQAIMAAAEKAAASNDFPSAAGYLREAATLQESTLGPAHPDLANTLNNLGVVCERISEFDEAERSFRRAYAIATEAFPADHEFVATSRGNLEEFCRLHGLSVEEPGTSTQQEGPAELAFDVEADARFNHGGSIEQDPPYGRKDLEDPAYERADLERTAVPIPPARGIWFDWLKLGMTAIAVVAIVWFAWPSRSIPEPPRSEAQGTTPNVIATPAPKPGPATSAPSTPPPAAESASPAPTPAPPAEPKIAAPQTPATTPPTSTDSPTVVDARVCRSLTTSGAWECDQVTGDAAPGPLYFFTRVAATRDMTIQHRWYFRDQLHQSVMLTIQPNSAGYRTYSRTTISPERTGDWRVELRTEDGRVLTEQRFTVR